MGIVMVTGLPPAEIGLLDPELQGENWNVQSRTGTVRSVASRPGTPRADSPLTRKGAQTRQRIVAAAADLVFQHGVAGTTLEDVRARAGVSSSQVYHYF